MTDETERLERVLTAFEQSVLDAEEGLLGELAEPVPAAKVVAGVLRAYGYERDGSRMRSSWPRARASRSRARGRLMRPTPATADTPLRASFRTPSPGEDDEPEGSDS